jgi:hypothetical protein
MKNPQAFPGITLDLARSMTDQGLSVYEGTESMTLRDYFAAKAMQSMVACSHGNWDEPAAIQAYHIADEMLKAREQ